MKFETAIALLTLLSPVPAQALSINKIMHKWRDRFGTELQLRTVQKYMRQLSGEHLKDQADKDEALVCVKRAGRDKLYFLRINEVAHLFLDHEKALQQILAHQALFNAFGTVAVPEVTMEIDGAEWVANNRPATSRLRQRVRIVADGIGRLHARIDPTALKACLEALGADKRLQFLYQNARGEAKEKNVNPLGLVAKDGTVYLVGCSSDQDQVVHYPLHRATNMHVSQHPAMGTASFDLDRHIEQTHQFSHQLAGESGHITLRLRVHRETLYHFNERPLCAGQRTEPMADGAWLVEAEIAKTFLLVPFLASMGSWIEVLAPDSVRTELDVFKGPRRLDA